MRPRIAIPLPTGSDFAYNERSWPQYARAVELSGGEPVQIELNQLPDVIASVVAECQGVLLPGSPADINPEKFGQARIPEAALPDQLREAADELLLQDAFNLGKPLLGICYGHQAMNVWRGGSLIQHLQTEVDHRPGREVRDAHLLEVTPDSRMARFLGEERAVNSSHHQAVLVPGDGLIISALCAIDHTVEAVEGSGNAFVVGVQWHPERTFDASHASRALFSEFLVAARSFAC